MCICVSIYFWKWWWISQCNVLHYIVFKYSYLFTYSTHIQTSFLSIHINITLSVVCTARCECEREDRWWDGIMIMIMPQHTTNSTTIGTAPRPHLPVSAQTLSSPGPLLLVNCVAWTENWGVICELDVLNNNNSTTAEQMIIGIKYIQSASARVISARQHVQNIGRFCKN